MSTPFVELATPSRSFFTLPPSAQPLTLPPKSNGFTYANPFNIDEATYQRVLSPVVPITFAAGYMTFVSTINAINRRRKNRPWPVSKTRTFYVFTILHNILLALYSGITCAAMVRALNVSFASPVEENGIAGTLDSLCKMSGPRGLGNAVYFNPEHDAWETKNSQTVLGLGGLPDSTDVGRLWNEGLGFWGWVFYLSKFYEVVDTLIIVAKGKRSATLQTYHHAGAMLCMWAGIRYMSPPIWMFALVNSGIHTLMYSYYTLSTLGVKVPQGLKQTLTTMQILQFLVGASFAAMHLFVSYSVPVTVPYKIATGVASSASSFASKATDTASVSSFAATVSGSVFPWLNKMVAWAAGSSGVAQNVLNERGESFGLSKGNAVEHVRYTTQQQKVHCLDTSGQAFAIWLNCLYLAPLTGLFVRFFVKAYVFGEPRTVRSDKKSHSSRRLSASELSMSAWKQTSRSVEAMGRSVERSIETMGREVEVGGEDLMTQEDVRRKLKEVYVESATTTSDEKDTEEAIDDDEVDDDEGAQVGVQVNGSAH